jgi:hypothetical protein
VIARKDTGRRAITQQGSSKVAQGVVPRTLLVTERRRILSPAEAATELGRALPLVAEVKAGWLGHQADSAWLSEVLRLVELHN